SAPSLESNGARCRGEAFRHRVNLTQRLARSFCPRTAARCKTRLWCGPANFADALGPAHGVRSPTMLIKTHPPQRPHGPETPRILTGKNRMRPLAVRSRTSISAVLTGALLRHTLARRGDANTSMAVAGSR